MNIFSYTPYDSVKLISRNEGKIKSFESCCDLRAWSHDIGKRDHYLRECIKYNMPTCVIPTSTLVCILRRMTYSSKGHATPRCHPRCKSKVVLESICTSCHAMKECFRNEEKFDKYFQDEEFETSDWPCEKCLEALKSIKMFWKIIIDKLFNGSVAKTEKLTQSNQTCCIDSVLSVAKVWQTDMLQQASFVKNIMPLLKSNSSWKGIGYLRRGAAPCNLAPCGLDVCETRNKPLKSTTLSSWDGIRKRPPFSCTKGSQSLKKEIASFNSRNKSLKRETARCNVTVSGLNDCEELNRFTEFTTTICEKLCKTTNTLDIPNNNMSRRNTPPSVQSKQTSIRMQTVDIACDCTKLSTEQLCGYKENLDFIQEKFQSQKEIIEKLKKENGSLRLELKNVYKNFGPRVWFNDPPIATHGSTTNASLPQPSKCYNFEDNAELDHVEPIDSEMIITMKKCKDESFKHISLLQVLHKTNAPIALDLYCNKTCKKEDPIELLTKVQNTFGAIVDREKSLANEKSCSKNKLDIDASFHKVNTSKSEPYCSKTTLTSFDSRYDIRFTHET